MIVTNDKEKKENREEYGDNRRNAKPIDIQEGDEVLMERAVKNNKLSSTFEPTIYKVIKRKGSKVTIESTENSKRYRRNVSHLKKVNGQIQMECGKVKKMARLKICQ